MIVLAGGSIPEQYRRIVVEREPVALDPAALARVETARARLLAHLATGAGAYGVTTGVGYLSQTGIDADQQRAFQRALLLRGAGQGQPLAPEVVRGAMLLRLTGFLDGAAGVSAASCTFLADRLNDGWTPVVPSRGITSASEVIALSHLFQTLVGEGLVIDDGEPIPAAAALARRGAAPYVPDVRLFLDAEGEDRPGCIRAGTSTRRRCRSSSTRSRSRSRRSATSPRSGCIACSTTGSRSCPTSWRATRGGRPAWSSCTSR